MNIIIVAVIVLLFNFVHQSPSMQSVLFIYHGDKSL